MTKDKIMNKLKKHWDFAATQYNEDQFLGIFLYGSQNYNFASEDSDVDSKIIYIPTFEEMCLNKNWLSVELQTEEKEHIEIKDIREMKLMWEKQNINFVELFYTEYFILNPKYEKVFKTYFIKNRELIAHYDRAKTIKSVGCQLLHTLAQGKTDNKKLYNAFRLSYFLQYYLLGFSYEKCIVPKGEIHDFLYELKYNCQWNEETKLSKAEELEQQIKELIDANYNIDSPMRESATAALETGVCEILKLSLYKEDSLTKEAFFEKLTDTEKDAYKAIVNEIQNEGYISLSKMIKKTNISRPVYNNLIAKLKEFKIAEVQSCGVKGTYIKIIHPQLKVSSIDFL